MGVFGSDATNTKFFQAGMATVSFGKANAKAIFLQVDIRFSRQIQPIPTIGSGIVWAAQIPSGTIQAQTVISKDGNIFNSIGDKGCDKDSLTIDLSNSCDAAGVTLTCNGVYCSEVGATISGSQGYVASSVTYQFSELSV